MFFYCIITTDIINFTYLVCDVVMIGMDSFSYNNLISVTKSFDDDLGIRKIILTIPIIHNTSSIKDIGEVIDRYYCYNYCYLLRLLFIIFIISIIFVLLRFYSYYNYYFITITILFIPLHYPLYHS